MMFARHYAVPTRSAHRNARLAAQLPTLAVFLLASLLLPTFAFAQQYYPSLYSGMQWRQIGPFRAGRVTGVTGVPGQPAIYYMGTAGGGAWKTSDGGMVWKPIFDKQDVASIGAIAVAPSNPEHRLHRHR